ncbi:MAG: BON domain-containing protein [Candidatus Methylomirabilales bacterium]
MRFGRKIMASALLGAGIWLAAAAPGLPQDKPAAPDNTRTNKGDRGPTADQQKENRADRELSRRIRKAITDDKSLSTYARNVKIIAQDGKVTLKGPVRSEEEKRAIEAKATQVAGDGNVTSEISIAQKQGETPRKAEKQG